MLERSNKAALGLAWSFVSGNFVLTVMAVTLLFVLDFFGRAFFPLGLVLLVVSYILRFAAQSYYAKKLEETVSQEQIADVARRTSLLDLFFGRALQGAALFLGYLATVVLFVALYALIAYVMVGDQLGQPGSYEAMMGEVLVMPMLAWGLIVSVFGYVLVGVYGRMLRSEGFVEITRSLFLLFSPAYWRGCFTRRYFLLVMGWSIIFFVIFVVAFGVRYALMYLFAKLFGSSPVMVLVGVMVVPALLMQFVGYYLSLYTATVSIFADEIVREERGE
jgi:MFS family permease